MDSLVTRHAARGYVRVTAKALIFFLVVMLVQFPDPSLMVRHIRHLRNMQAMIQPSAPELAPFEAEIRTRLGLSAGPQSAARLVYLGRGGWRYVRPPSSRDVQRAVEQFVYEKVKYDWDWNVWGSADYMPTVSEMFSRAAQYPDGQIREDCDGHAVLAASLLARLGYPAHLVTDFGHVWVQTFDADKRPVELMSPGRTKSVVSSSGGNRFTWAGLANLPRALAYGLTVFPWGREAIVFATLMLLLAHRRMSRSAAVVGGTLALAGWHLLRANADYWSGGMINAWLGLAYLLAGCAVIFVASRRARRRAAAGIPG